MKGLSLFSSAGIGETYLNDLDMEIVTANELVPKRAELYKKIYSHTNMICGDISDEKTFKKIIDNSKNIDFIIASPPCQGMSVAGKNRSISTMAVDERNYLFLYVVKAIKELNPKFVLIENVPNLLKLNIYYKNQYMTVIDILKEEFSANYNIDSAILNCSDYGVPQNRLRAIIKLYKKNIYWKWPDKVDKKVTVRECIGELPSLESGESSSIKWHFARKHSEKHIEWMKHTPTGCSAFDNKVFFPVKQNGEKIKGYNSSYRRILWDEPAPTITIRNDAISSQRNVHPGRLLPDGTYSDARVLTPLELMLLDSLPQDWNIPDDTSEILIRQCIGESIPPLLMKKIFEELEMK